MIHSGCYITLNVYFSYTSSEPQIIETQGKKLFKSFFIRNEKNRCIIK